MANKPNLRKVIGYVILMAILAILFNVGMVLSTGRAKARLTGLILAPIVFAPFLIFYWLAPTRVREFLAARQTLALFFAVLLFIAIIAAISIWVRATGGNSWFRM